MKSICIVVPHYGSDEYLDNLLVSLGHSIQDDPWPKDKKSFVLQAPFGEIYVWNGNIENIGFTAASNNGAIYAMQANHSIVWLLNNDTTVPDPGAAIQAILEEFQNPKTGVIGFRIVTMDDEDFIHHGGTGRCFPSGEHKVGRISQGHHDKRTKEKWVTGASIAISSDCFTQVGLLDNKMYNYGSDSDFCYRARYAGFDVVYLPVTIVHKTGQSANPNPTQLRLIKADMLTFQVKWMGKLFFDLDGEQLDT